MKRKKAIGLTFGVALLAVGAFMYGSYSTATNGAAFQFLRSAKKLITGKEADDINAAIRRARLSIFEASTAKADVVMLGDSLTQHMVWSEAFQDVRIANRGIGGDTTGAMIDRLDNVLALKPRKVFVMAGVNDFYLDRANVDSVFDNHKRIVSDLSRHGVQVIVQSTLYVAQQKGAELNAKIAQLNERLRNFCAGGNCRYVDLNSSLAPSGVLEPAMTWDGIHLNGAAYRIWTQKIASLMH